MLFYVYINTHTYHHVYMKMCPACFKAEWFWIEMCRKNVKFCPHFSDNTVRVKISYSESAISAKKCSHTKLSKILLAGNFSKMESRSKSPVRGNLADIQLVCTRMLIWNNPMNTEDIPENWKKDNTVPVLKKTKWANPRNYRAVIIVSIQGNIIEWLIWDSLNKEIKEKNWMDDISIWKVDSVKITFYCVRLLLWLQNGIVFMQDT